MASTETLTITFISLMSKNVFLKNFMIHVDTTLPLVAKKNMIWKQYETWCENNMKLVETNDSYCNQDWLMTHLVYFKINFKSILLLYFYQYHGFQHQGIIIISRNTCWKWIKRDNITIPLSPQDK